MLAHEARRRGNGGRVDSDRAARDGGAVDDDRVVRLALTAAEVELLTEALDSHEYWQLSDPTWRNSGYVILPGEDVPVDRPLDDDQRRAVDEIRTVRLLQDRLRAGAAGP